MAVTRRLEIVGEIERGIETETGKKLSEPEESLEVRPRERIPFRQIARTAFSRYPRRTTLGLALFVGQAFMYNAVTFDLGTLLGEFFDVASGTIPIFIAIFAISNFLGPLTLGRLFDTVGRKPMIAGTYLVSAALTVALGIALLGNGLTTWSFMAFVLAIFFVASAGASSAYLTVSEIFPMETRALSIAFFFAVGTAAGGIAGPLLFGHLIATGSQDKVAIGFFIGAAVMTLGGIAEILFGVKAEQESLEKIAKPLTAEDAEQAPKGKGKEKKAEKRRQRRPSASPGMPILGPYVEPGLEREVETIERALREHGEATRRELGRRVGARYWGPGRFHAALREATMEKRIKRLRRDHYAPS